MELHKNYRKTIYKENGIYFVTSVTDKRYPYFMSPLNIDEIEMEEVFCNIFVKNLFYAQKIKGFELFAFVLLPEHFHLLIKIGKHNVSEIMKGFKRNVSYDINKILEMFKSGETSMSRLTRNQFDINKEKKINFDIYRNILKQKYGEKYPMFPQFKWQRGYNYQIVETKERFKFYKDYYIPTNPKKHNVMEDWWNYPWSSINNKMFN